jgi:hypothetical protein
MRSVKTFSPSYNLMYARRSSDLSCATARMLLCIYMTPQTVSSSVTVALVFWPEFSASPAASRFGRGISPGWCGEQLSPLQNSQQSPLKANREVSDLIGPGSQKFIFFSDLNVVYKGAGRRADTGDILLAAHWRLPDCTPPADRTQPSCNQTLLHHYWG